MRDIVQPDFNPQWRAMYIENVCPECGFVANGTTHKKDLLTAPVDCKCRKCYHEWSIAIPLGKCEQREEIERLIKLSEEYVILRDRINRVFKELQEG